MVKRLRLLLLLFILLAVMLSAALARWRMHAWDRPQVVALYPISADGLPATEAYLQRLDGAAFGAMQEFFAAEAARHGLRLSQPFRFELGRRISRQPPAPPSHTGPLAAISWSLRMRWWAWHETPATSPVPDVRLYLMFHAPSRETQRLPHSVGLQKGRLGLAHLFASPAQQGSNQVVIAHELLHTFGASDKYDGASLQPRPPEGYAEPERFPPLPQLKAELMAGRIPLSETESRIPSGLNETLVGERSAREIGWRR